MYKLAKHTAYLVDMRTALVNWETEKAERTAQGCDWAQFDCGLAGRLYEALVEILVNDRERPDPCKATSAGRADITGKLHSYECKQGQSQLSVGFFAESGEVNTFSTAEDAVKALSRAIRACKGGRVVYCHQFTAYQLSRLVKGHAEDLIVVDRIDWLRAVKKYGIAKRRIDNTWEISIPQGRTGFEKELESHRIPTAEAL